MGDHKPEVSAGQIYQDKDARRCERFIKVIAADRFDALVRSCDLRGEFCPKTPRTSISVARIQKRFKLVTQMATINQPSQEFEHLLSPEKKDGNGHA